MGFFLFSLLSFSFLKKYLIFNGWIIALQYYVGFYQTSTWISHRFAPPTWTSLPPLSPSHCSRLLRGPGLSSLSHTASSRWLSVLHMVAHVSMSLSSYTLPPPSSPLSLVRKSVLYVCLCCCSANRPNSTIFLDSIYNALVYDICFSLSDLLHSVWQILGSSTSLQLTQFHSFYGWVIFHCI